MISYFKQRGLLVWNKLCVQLPNPVQSKVTQLHTGMQVIGSGLTSVLQPLDIYLNVPLKDCVRKVWMEWKLSGVAKGVSRRNLMCHWLENR